MKLWVDDERNAPDDTWLVARTSKDAKSFLYLNASESIEDPSAAFTHVSLDHDLGGDDTGMMVLDYMIKMRLWPTEELTIHTMNPPARKRMLQAAATEAPAELPITFITSHRV